MIKAGVISMDCWILNLKGFPRLFGDIMVSDLELLKDLIQAQFEGTM